MSHRRSTTPLFELLDKSRPIEPLPEPKPIVDSQSSAPSEPVTREAKVSPSRASPAQAARPVRPSLAKPNPTAEPRLMAGGYGRPALAGGLLIVPVPFALIGLGILFVLGAVLWATAWHFGDNRARTEEQAKFAALGGSNIVDPIADPGRGTGEPGSGSAPTNQAGSPPTRPSNQPSNQPANQPGRQPAASSSDSRQAGFNYLRLATLDRDQAVEAVDRLKAGGVDAFMIPLETGARRGNNPARYVVYLSKGFAGGGAFSASRSQREQLTASARRIGEAWAKEGGPTAFQEPFWDKYVP